MAHCISCFIQPAWHGGHRNVENKEYRIWSLVQEYLVGWDSWNILTHKTLGSHSSKTKEDRAPPVIDTWVSLRFSDNNFRDFCSYVSVCVMCTSLEWGFRVSPCWLSRVSSLVCIQGLASLFLDTTKQWHGLPLGIQGHQAIQHSSLDWLHNICKTWTFFDIQCYYFGFWQEANGVDYGVKPCTRI